MIPEEIILNAAENIQANLARLTDLEVKHQQLDSKVDNITVDLEDEIKTVATDLITKYKYLISFGRRLFTDSETGSYDSEEAALTDVYNLFYQSDDTSDMASAQVGTTTYIFIKSRYQVSKLIMLNTTEGKFYVVDKSTCSFVKTLLFYGANEVAKDISIAITELYDTLLKYIDAQDEVVKGYADSLSEGDKQYTDSSFANAVGHANNLFTQVNDRLNAVLDGADADFDSFKELAAQIKAFKLEHADFLEAIKSLTTETVTDSATTSIVRTLNNNTDYTYIADNISSIVLKIPSDIKHGYAAGVNFKTGSLKPGFSLVNNSSYSLKFLVNGRGVDSFTPESNQNYMCLAICNGINVVFQIVEIE